MKLKSGDIVEFTQEDGNRIILIVYRNGICIKANDLGTKLVINRGSSFMVKATAVDRR